MKSGRPPGQLTGWVNRGEGGVLGPDTESSRISKNGSKTHAWTGNGRAENVIVPAHHPEKQTGDSGSPPTQPHEEKSEKIEEFVQGVYGPARDHEREKL